MNKPTTDQQAVTVAQEDREAAANWARDGWPTRNAAAFAAGIVDGVSDSGALVQAFARHRLASVSSASAEGWKLVPTWPTLAMLQAGGDCYGDSMTSDVWSAMLAASPEPVPATNQAGEVERLRAAILPHMPFGFKFDAAYRDAVVERIVGSVIAALATQPATSQEGEVRADAIAKSVADRCQGSRKPGQSPNRYSVIYQAARLGAIEAVATTPKLSALPEGLQAIIEKHVPLGTVIDADARDACVEDIADDIAALAATPTPPTLSEDLREALKPFADAAADYDYHDGQPAFDEYPDASSLPEINDLTIGNLRAARAALAQVKAS
jgi:hypothetical protein